METKGWFYRDDIRHKRALRGYRFGLNGAAFGKHGLWFFDGTNFQIAMRIIIHGILLLLMKSWFKLWSKALIAYVALHVVTWIVCGILEKKNRAVLQDLQQQYTKLQEQYFSQQCAQNGICNGCITFEDGLVVASGRILAEMNADVGFFRVYQLENVDDEIAWDNYKRALPKGEKTFLEYIPSLEFRKKFGIQTSRMGGDENMRYMKYFNPSVQLQMLKTKELRTFQNIEASQGTLKADTKETVASPEVVDVYDGKKLSGYFLEVDRYCKEMRDMGQRVHKAFCQVAFLRG